MRRRSANADFAQQKPYVVHAQARNYAIDIVDSAAPWRLDAEELARRNKHGVPLVAIEAQLRRLQNYTVDDILAAKNPHEQAPSPDARQSATQSHDSAEAKITTAEDESTDVELDAGMASDAEDLSNDNAAEESVVVDGHDVHAAHCRHYRPPEVIEHSATPHEAQSPEEASEEFSKDERQTQSVNFDILKHLPTAPFYQYPGSLTSAPLPGK